MKKQLSFFQSKPGFFGGLLLHGKRRSQRPLSKREPIHLVLRSSWARGKHSFLQFRNKSAIESFISTLAKKHGVRIYQKAIVSNHLHLVIRIHNRSHYAGFIRSLAGKIASHVMQGLSFKEFQTRLAGDGVNTDEIQGLGQKFFQFRPFTRVMKWGKDFKTCCEYVVQNINEAIGFTKYTPRNERYARWIKDGAIK